MRTKTIEIYAFHELSDAAKDAARDKLREWPDLWAWGEDCWKSAKAFSEIAPLEITEADYYRAQVSVRWKWGTELAEMSGLRAWKWLENNGWFKWARANKQGDCTMTGYCADCDFADPIIDYERKPRHVPALSQLFYECAQSWVYAARRDMEYCYSDAAIDELIECNEWEFYENGAIA